MNADADDEPYNVEGVFELGKTLTSLSVVMDQSLIFSTGQIEDGLFGPQWNQFPWKDWVRGQAAMLRCVGSSQPSLHPTEKSNATRINGTD